MTLSQFAGCFILASVAWTVGLIVWPDVVGPITVGAAVLALTVYAVGLITGRLHL